MSDLKERQQQLREDAIIEMAQKLLFEQGFNALNMDELASRVGISKATLYQHFSSKDELVIRTVLYHMQQGEKKVRDSMSDMSPIEVLEHMVRYSVSRRIMMSASHFELPPHLREDPRIKKQHARLTTFLGDMIEKGKADGSIRAELSVPVVICTFFTIFTPAHQELLRDEVVTPEEVSETLVTIFLKGIQTQ
jgi:AcrR family transcriptional regulator